MPEKAPRAARYLDVGSRLDTMPAPTAPPEISVGAAPDTIPQPTLPISPEGHTPTPDTAPAAPASPNTLSTPEANPATSAETRATDIEVLGKHYPVRQMIHEIGNQRMRAAESFTAGLKNFLDTPGKLRLGLMRSLAEGRLNRKQAKFDAVSHLSDKNWLKKRRMRKLMKAQAKFNAADRAYNGRKDRMKARIENVGKNVEKRRAAYRKELRGRREAALSRRALRHELRAQGASHIEVRSILKDVPKEHLERVGKIAATAYASERRAAQARKEEKRTIDRETRTLNAIDDNRRRKSEAASEAKKADGIVEKLETETIPKAKESLQSLRNDLAALESDDPARASLEEQIQAAEDRIKLYEEQEVPYWNQVALNNRQRVIALDSNHTSLTANLSRATAAKTRASTNTAAAQATARAHADELAKAASEATNSSSTPSN